MLTLIQIVVLCYLVIPVVLVCVLPSVFDPLALQLLTLLIIVIYIYIIVHVN